MGTSMEEGKASIMITGLLSKVECLPAFLHSYAGDMLMTGDGEEQTLNHRLHVRSVGSANMLNHPYVLHKLALMSLSNKENRSSEKVVFCPR